MKSVQSTLEQNPVENYNYKITFLHGVDRIKSISILIDISTAK